MSILVIGLILFLGVHSLRLIAPVVRGGIIARLGEGPYKSIYSLASGIGFILIVWGFARASADYGLVYVPSAWLRHVTMALMLVALILAVASVLPPGRIKRAVRHPLLIGAVIWAVAHLFVNGELAGLVLFGAFLVWAVVDLSAQTSRPVDASAPPSPTSDIVAVVAGAALYALLVWRLHAWLFGVSPIG
ncbi:MAG: NnrU family protein [Bauldia sp.]|nr:MAG: NnrU family protein [Bauldia sp.]MBZ0229196.1 NnrU family protein [Bauldia sp.]